MDQTAMIEKIRQEISNCDKLLIGIGEEWKAGQTEDMDALYDKLGRLVAGKDYFIVTTVTDAHIFEASLRQQGVTSAGAAHQAAGQPSAQSAGIPACAPSLDVRRMVAPCGNVTWQQCSESCTKDIWEPGEVKDGRCPHCGALLTGNTIEAKVYIEEGYMPQWNAYTRWLAGTLNKKLTILELGVGFATPTVIRWPFEKTASVNQKAHLYRIHGKFAQLSEEVREKADSISENSVDFFRNL